jgi:transcriptional regulator with XRE-family HTH domain
MNSLVRRFGIVVRQQRGARGWSQIELAGRADIDRSYIGEIERGSVVASLVTVDKLAVAFDIDVTVLLGHCQQLDAVRLVHDARLMAIAR